MNGTDRPYDLRDLRVQVVAGMPQACLPAMASRRKSLTLVHVDAFADRYELLRWLMTELDDYELDTFREAMQWHDGMVPEAWLEEVGPMSLPESLWMSHHALLRGLDDLS